MPSYFWCNSFYQVVEFQVGELQGELGECKIRVGTQEKMLAQKELQLLDLHEKHGALQAERDSLKGELQHLKTQHCSALKEAHEQAHRMMVNAVGVFSTSNGLHNITISNKLSSFKFRRQHWSSKRKIWLWLMSSKSKRWQTCLQN